MRNILAFMKEKYYVLFFITIFSIFLTSFKLYVPLFVINIIYVSVLIIKKEIDTKLSTWQKFLGAFVIFSIIGTVVATFIYKNEVNLMNVVKLNINCIFLICVSMIFQQDYVKVDRKKLVTFLEFIIIINFIQVIVIYVFGGLFTEFLSGSLSQSSDSAYIIGQFNNIIGGDNKNIWASKLAFVYIIYLYALVSFKISNKFKYVNVILGGLTMLLILSRTAQLAIAVPVLFYALHTINTFEDKYSKPLFFIFGIAIGMGGMIFFDKFFHIKFDMSDGGFTRLYIWKEFLINVWDTHWILGNGIGYSAIFISEVIGRYESNLHNVLFNTFFEMGAIGLVAYIGFVSTFAKEYINRSNIKMITYLVIIPVVFILSLQYLGYDNDIVMVIILFLLVTKLSAKKDVLDVK